MSELFSERLGEAGPHIIVLHGWGNSLATVKPLGELLANQAAVHLIDLPGFGQSAAPERVWDSFDYADKIIAYMKEQKIEKAHLVGHSFGGKVAMSLASRYPHYADSLTLIGAAGLKRERTVKDYLRLKAILVVGKLLKGIDAICGTSYFEELVVKRYGSDDYRKAGKMRGVLVKSVNEDLSEEIAKITAPTLLLWGEEDSATPVQMGKKLNALIKGSSLYVFPGKGHQLYHEGGAPLCASYILAFMRQRGGGDGTVIK